MISSKSAYFSLINQSIWRKKLVAWTMLLLMATQPMTAAAEVVADSKAAGGNRPLVETSANGLPIVQITQPSAAGISRNQYQQFNVDSRGLILNNSGIITQTQLAGYITGNPFIGHGPSARIILNEVTSKDPSYLRGYTEVAGQKADIIIANPNGIYGDGFGFINTNRAVLTTGTPVFGGSGSLDAFRVSGGQISIQGTGMNAANVDQVDLISRSVAINAQVWAKNLNVVTGSNKVDYKTMDTKTFDSDVASPQVAIDVGQLGGMYAQKIYMVGTEKGLGVNSTGTIAAQAGDITITSAGKLLLANTSATGNIQVAAAEDVTNQKALYAQGNVDITTSGTLHNSGILTARQSTNITAQNVQSIGIVGAGIKNDGTVGTAGNLTVNAAGTIAMNGQNLAAGDLNITGSTLSLANSKTLANGNANLTAVIGDMDHTKGSLQVNGDLSVTAQGAIHNDTANVEAKKLSLIAHSLSNRSGAITQLGKETTTIKAAEGVDNTAGIIATNGDSLQIKSNSLQNSQGQIQHAGTGELSLEMAGDIQNDAGKMATNGQLQLSAQNLNNANGQIIGQKKVNMTTQTLSNQAGRITAQDNLTITATNGIDSNLKSSDVHDTGSIVSGGDLLLTSTGKMLLSGTTSANGDIQIHARDGLSNYSSLYGQGKTDIWTQSVLENSANLITAQNMNITAQSIKSSGTIGAGIQQDGKLGKDGDLTIHAGGTITTQGQNVAAKDLTITGSALTLAGSKTIAGGNGILTATTGDIDHNRATLQIGKNLAATAKGIIYNDNGTIYTENLSLVGKGISNRNGTMSQLGKEVTILSALENIDNRNGIIATNADLLQIKADSLTNSQGQIQHAGTGALSVQTIGNIQNDKGTLATNGKLRVDAKNLDNTKGEIIGQKQVNIITQADIINSQGTIKGSDTVHIAAQGNMNNEQGTIEAKKGMGINVQSLNNQSGLIANLDASRMQVKISQGIQNQSGNISSNGKVDITAQDLSNQGGQITAQGDLTIAAANGIDSNLAAADVKNDGTIASGGDLTLTSAGKVLLSGSTSANGSIQVNAQDGLTNYSELYAAGNTTLTTVGTLQNSGAILSGQNTSMTAETVTSAGILGAGIQTNGTVGSSGDLTIMATDKVTTHGKNLAAGNLKVKAGSIDLSGSTTYAGSSAELTAAAGDIDNMGASLQTAGTLTAISSGTIRNDQDANQVKGEIKAGQLTLTADAISNQGGSLAQIGSGITTLTANTSIDNTGGEVFTNGEAIQIKANSLINSQGKLEHAGTGNLVVETITNVTNDDGKLATNGQLHLIAQKVDNTRGILSAKNMDITSRDAIDNRQGLITSSGDTLLSAQGAVNNEQGSIEASKGLIVTAQSLNNQKGRIVSLGTSNMKVTTSQEIQNQSGLIGGNGKVEITAKHLSNQSGKITAQSNLTIAAANGIDSNLAAGDVKDDGTIASGGDLTLTSAGKVLMSGSTSANGSIQVNAQDGLSNYSELYAGGNTTLTTSGTLQNAGAILSGQNTSMTAETVTSAGILGAGIQTNGTVGSSGDLTIMATDKVTTHGRNLAAGNLKVKAGAIDLSGSTTYAGSSAELTAVAGDINNTGASLQTAGTLTAIASGTIRNDQDANQVKGEIKAGQLTLTADGISNQGGSLVQIGSGLTNLTANNSIDNTGGEVFTNGDAIQIKANSLINSQGKLEHAGTGLLSVETEENYKNDDGKLATNGQLYLTSQEIDNTRGIISAKNIDITSQSAIDNRQGLITSSGDTLLSAQGTVNNEQGSIEASKGLILTVQSLNNQKGRIVSLGTSNMKVTTSQDIQNQSGLIGGNGKVEITAKHLSNQSGKITAQSNLTIAAASGIDSNLAAGDVKDDGTIASGGDLTLTSAGKVLLSGSTSANGSIQVNAQDGLTNYSELYAGGNTTLTTVGTLQNSGAILSGKNTSMTAETVTSAGILGAGIQTNGTVGSSGDLTIMATDKVTTHGRNLAAGNLKVKAGAIDLSGSTTYAGSSAELTAVAGDINNTGASLQTAGTLTAIASGTIRNDQDANQVKGEIKAGQLTLTADGISNQGGNLTQIGLGTTNLTANNSIDNTGGEIFTNGESIQIKANSLINSQGKLEHAGTGTLWIHTEDDFKNDNGKVASNSKINLKTKSIHNENGIIAAQKRLDITSASTFNNSKGFISSIDDTIQITAQGLVNNQEGNIEANKGLNLTAQSLNNANGRIVNVDNSDMKVVVTEGIVNQSGLMGGNGNVRLEAESFNNQTGQVLAEGNLAISVAKGINNIDGKIIAKKNIELSQSAADLNNNRGTIGAGSDLVLQAKAVNNNGGKLGADKDSNITAQSIQGIGQIIAGQDLNISLNSDYANEKGNELKANRNLRMTTTGMITNQGTIGAVENVNVSGSSILNDTESILTSGNTLTANATGSIINKGTIEGDAVNISGDNIQNTGAIFGHNLIVTADKITNEGSSAVIATTGNASLYARTAVENKDDASIYSMGDIAIAGSKDKNSIGEYINRTGNVLNQSANIEAEKDISIYADEITNKKREFVTEQTVVSTNTTHETAAVPVAKSGNDISGGYYESYDRDEGFTWHKEKSLLPIYYYEVPWAGGDVVRVTYVNKDQTDTVTVAETRVVKDSPLGKIMSGGNMTLRANSVNNEVSWILANGILNTVAGSINNTAVGSSRVTTYDSKAVYRKHFYRRSGHSGGYENDYSWDTIDYYEYETIPSHNETTEQLPGYTSLYGGGQGVTIQAQTITNQTIQPSGAPVGDMATTVAPTGNIEIPVGNTSSGITVGGNIGNPVSNKSNTVTPGSNSGASVSSTTSGIATGKNIGTSISNNTNTVMPGNSLGISVSNTASGITAGGNIDVPTETKNPSVTPGGNSGIPVGTVVQEQNSSLNVDGTGKSLPSDPQIMNIGKGSPSSNEFIVPTSGLFTIHTEPEHKYLVETNTHFTSYKNFASSDYMLQKITSDPEKTQKRLGDGFYEQKLVREQITNLTGRSSLDSSVSSEEEFKTLMNNGVTYAQEFNLHVGVALTSEQMKQLTSDIIWLEEREVDGQKVLVPVVYLSQVRDSDLKPTGALITGDTINITATGNLTNSGTIHADTQSAITASNIINRGGVIDGGSMTKLTATQDIINQSGMITGGQLDLSAKRDIINETLVSAVNVGPIQTTLVNQIGTIAAKDGLTVQAGRDILISGAQVSASKEIDLNAGRNIEITSVEHQQQLKTVLGNVKVSSETTTSISSSIKAGDNLTITAQKDITLQGAQVKAGQAVAISAGNTLEISSVENRENGSAATTSPRNFNNTNISYDKTTNVASNIESGSDITLKANDINLRGTQINAVQNIDIAANQNLTVTSVQDTSSLQVHGSSILNRTSALEAIGISNTDISAMPVKSNGFHGYGSSAKFKSTTSDVTNVASNITAGNNVSIISTGDTNLQGAQVAAGNALDIAAVGNINISAVKDETISDQTIDIRHGWKKTKTDDETVIGTTLQGDNKVTITAGHLPGSTEINSTEGNINIEGSHIASDNGKVEITADKDITIQDVTEKHESLVVTHKKKSGFLSSKTTDTMNHALINEVVGSTISGDTVAVISGNDLTVKGSNVVGTNDVTFTAQNDVTITSAAETGADEHYSYTKKSGLFSGGGLGFTIGSQSTKTTTKEQTLGEVGSTIGSIDGNVSITAGEKVNSEGTTFVSGNDLSITGKEVTIDNTVDTYDSQTKYEFKQSGLSVSLGGGIVNTATSAYNNIERSGQVEDERLQALYDYKAIKDLDKINDQLSKGVSKENLKKDVSVSISIGSTKMTSEQTVHTETVNTSNMNAGGDVTIKATEDDVNLKGTNINAKNITLDAAENINIGAAENKQQTTTNTSSSSWAFGGTIGSGFFGNVSKGSGKENENATTNTGSVIDANDTLKIKSGADTNIIGSQVKGDTVVANVDGNLNIVSKQDTDDYTSKNQSSGFGISTGPKGGITGSVSKGKTDSTYASVTEQAGIHAGEGGFDIHVGKNTDLKGAVIASDAIPDKNKLSTGTLTYSDIQNKAEYSASSSGVNLDTRKGAEKKDAGLTPNIGVKVSGDSDSTTKSAIAPGTITITGNQTQDLSNLSRDTNNSLNVLGKIFDKKTVQEQQELAKVFGEEVFKAVGNLKLKEGSSEKAAIDFFVGGLMAKLGGGDFLSGAASGGITQLVMKELANIKDPALLQWASAVVGAASAKVIGGNAQTGASVAVSETKNNYLSHEQYRKMLEELDQVDKSNKSPEEKEKEKATIKAEYEKIDKEQDQKWESEHQEMQ
ncbi:hemagglutinin repeat-containing protein [Pelosinus fermentans]|uniref:Filamentous hemagglutinin family outer membrane protein n=1 Tax=Pelosinus fermentans JBW45 TaxID=1192197 RepID=A0A0C5Q0Y8_9FIRM|nr:hemagglutinin repeat-containing protein [Pelosinus fermentans]AJQ28773.1 filamentous hemagglutinin family outer membrane protein [Pelosinus fermentans JBW45]